MVRGVGDLVNQDIRTAKGVARVCIIGLSINENLKLEKGKGKNSSAV